MLLPHDHLSSLRYKNGNVTRGVSGNNTCLNVLPVRLLAVAEVHADAERVVLDAGSRDLADSASQASSTRYATMLRKCQYTSGIYAGSAADSTVDA